MSGAAGARFYLAVALGGALGAVARYLSSVALVAVAGSAFPWGTLSVNALGSLIIGLYAALAEPGGRLRAGAATHLFVAAGFCGGFTTLSVFSLETLRLVESGRVALASAYVAASLVLWLAAVGLGWRAGTALNRGARR